MGLIKEPINIDFTVEPKNLSKAESLLISKFIAISKKYGEKKAMEIVKKGKLNASISSN